MLESRNKLRRKTRGALEILKAVTKQPEKEAWGLNDKGQHRLIHALIKMKPQKRETEEIKEENMTATGRTGKGPNDE